MSSGTPSQSGSDTILCEWLGCDQTFQDPEAIYAHLCDDHVGRKSTGNLCLDCKWKGCEVTCATKRHHITSHLIVHVPFKPHGCPLCDKTFKRPQDLKKHERTHTGLPANGPVGQRPQPQPQSQTSHSSPLTSREVTPSEQMYGLPRPYTSSLYHSAPHGYPPSGLSGNHLPPPPPQRITSPPHSYPAVAYNVSTLESSSGSYSGRSSTFEGSFYPSQHPQYPTPPNSAYDHPRDAYRRSSDTRGASHQYSMHGAVKRGHDEMAVGDFLESAQRKRMAPTYDTAMAERLINTFGDSDISTIALDSLLPASFDTPAKSFLGQPSTPSADADLNSWLLQLGAAIAHETTPPPDLSDSGSTASPASGVDSPYAFDVSTLESLGLTSIPGWDESLLTPNDPPFMPKWMDEGATSRPIAQLPSRRERETSVNSDLSYPTPPPAYSSPGNTGATSFDSIRAARGNSLVAQLAPAEHNIRTYRHVEPLTRAPPLMHERAMSRDAGSRGSKTSAGSDDEMEDGESRTPVHGSSSLPKLPAIGSLDRGMAAYHERALSPSNASEPSSSSHISLYPKVSMGDPSRRLPSLTPAAHRTHSNGPSIASILSGPYTSASRGGYAGTSLHTSSPSSRAMSLSPEDSPQRSMYPSLRSLGASSRDSTDEESSQGVRQQQDRRSSAAPSGVPLETRRQHLALIRNLLVALNKRQRRRNGRALSEDEAMQEQPPTPTQASVSHQLTLPPLRRLGSGEGPSRARSIDFDPPVLPSQTSKQHHNPQRFYARSLSHGSSSTSTPREGLPGISQLLLNAAAVAQGQGGMDVDG